jgi:hypothetical protein
MPDFRKINFKPILFAGRIIAALFVLFFIIKTLPKILPASPALNVTVTSQASQVTVTSLTPTITPMLVPEKDGMIMIFVSAGEFLMGSGGEVHKVTLDSYWIDQIEVTNAMYAKMCGRRRLPAAIVYWFPAAVVYRFFPTFQLLWQS